MSTAYSALAKVYEYLICDEDYQKWADYLVEKIKQYAPTNVGVDCACGSGFFTRALKRGGFEVSGIDFSNEMLAEATTLTAKEKLKISYLQGDMSNLKVFQKVGFVTVVNDGINYLPKNKLEKTFKAFYHALEKNGVLAFDISSEYKLKNIIGDNMFGEDTDDCSYLWFNKLTGDKIEMDISIFMREGKSQNFIKKEENHTQYIYSSEEIENALKAVGFEILEICSHLGEKISFDSERIEFIAKKV